MIIKTFGNNVATLDFGNIDSAYIIKVVSKYTPTSDGELDIAQGTSMRTTDSMVIIIMQDIQTSS